MGTCRAGRWKARPSVIKMRPVVVALSVSGHLEVPGLEEMAGTVALAWIRGPGSECKAVRCASDRCTVRDLIHRHCQDQVSIAVPGR